MLKLADNNHLPDKGNAIWELCSAMECMLHAVKSMLMEQDELVESLEEKESTIEDMQDRLDELNAEVRKKGR